MTTMTARQQETALNDAQYFLDKWYMTASSGGGLWIQPRVPIVRVDDFCMMLRRVQQACIDRPFTFVAFHFEGVQVIHTSWQVMLRAAEAVANSLHAECRVIWSREPVGFGDVAREVRRLRSTSGAEGGSLWMKSLDGTSIIITPAGSPTRRPHGSVSPQ